MQELLETTLEQSQRLEGNPPMQLLFLDRLAVAHQRLKKTENKIKPQITDNTALNKFISSPMSGTVIKYLVKANDKIKTNQEVAIIESMKMETTLKSDVDGTILEILIAPGGVIQAQEPIIKIN